MTIHPLFTFHTLRSLYVFFNVLDFIVEEWSLYQNVQYFIRNKNVFWILPQLDSLCTSAVKRYYTKSKNSPFTCHLFSRVSEFIEATSLLPTVVRTSDCLTSYSAWELCNKNYIVKISETLIICSASYITLLGLINQDTIKGTRDRLLTRVAIV